MSRSHAAHSHGPPGASDAGAPVVVGRRPRALLLLALALTLAATVAGVVAVWPDAGRVAAIRDSVDFAAEGVSFPDGEVVSVAPACSAGEAVEVDDPCGQLVVDVVSGAGAGTRVSVRVAPDVSASGLQPGDDVRLVRVPGAEGQEATFNYQTTERGLPIAWMLLAFVLLVVLIARLRGLMALVGLVFSGLVVWRFMLPALLSGESGTVVALTTASAIMFVVLYTTHGFSLRTSVALAGTLAGIGLTGLLGLVAVGTARLTGVPDDSGGAALGAAASDVSFQGLLQCGVIIAGLGVLNDVTITQASAVWELRSASPGLSRRRAFTAGMRIGRDHIASTIYTIVFAYTGTALILLLLVYVYDQPFLDLVSSEELAEEVLRTLTSGIGLVLAVPLTTALAALIAATGPTTSTAGGEPDEQDDDPREYAEEHPDFWGRWR